MLLRRDGGAPALRSLLIQPLNDRALGPRAWFEDSIAPIRALVEYAEEVVVLEKGYDLFGTFEPREMWRLPDEERYWGLNPWDRAQY